jgi:hypothetical protein
MRLGHQNSTYCKAQVPQTSTYQKPHPRAKLKQLFVFARHGDRSPQNVLLDDTQGQVTWNCDSVEYLYLHDRTSSSAEQSNRSSKSPIFVSQLVARKDTKLPHASWQPRIWNGTCALAELTARGRSMFLDFGKSFRELYGTQSLIISAFRGIQVNYF